MFFFALSIGSFEPIRFSFKQNVVSDQLIDFHGQTLDHANEKSIHFRCNNCQFIFEHSFNGDIGSLLGSNRRKSIDLQAKRKEMLSNGRKFIFLIDKLKMITLN